ncbi:fatty acid desaturase [Leptothoe spongobia]|uniref:Fatty acid desaturase n=1 Tax=Leptothoe spongobia TAU-MAC 1115 TaxID=1967444 RepID=A0A947DGG2_9CYAN|nr:fatty acid desaturase [Leptothoe spongobia TAU-MAC 1115]
MLLWLSSLEFLALIDIRQLSLLWFLPAILGRTFLQTGLFIVAHDAIHGAVLPGSLRLNYWFGQLAVTLYAFLSYQKLSLNHWQHHRHPGQASDPDFHDGIHRNIFAWYLKFMQSYLDVKQSVSLFFGIGILFLTLHVGFHIPVVNLLLFWILPIFLSSIQLFFFGIFLPHRLCSESFAGSGDIENSHCSTSSYYPIIWSFITCYHLGYHWEHHEYPYLPWYKLPFVQKSKQHKFREMRQFLTKKCR